MATQAGAAPGQRRKQHPPSSTPRNTSRTTTTPASRSSPSRNCCPERGQTIRAWPRIPPSAAHPGAGVPPGLSPGSPSRPTSLGIVHYGPGDRPLCGRESPFAIYTFEPDQVTGCQECLELVDEDLQPRWPLGRSATTRPRESPDQDYLSYPREHTTPSCRPSGTRRGTPGCETHESPARLRQRHTGPSVARPIIVTLIQSWLQGVACINQVAAS